MADITSNQLMRIYASDSPDLTGLYELSDVSAGDTLDLGMTGASQDYLTVRSATFLSTTSAVATGCAVSGTVVTMPDTLDADAGYLTAWGDQR